MKDMHLVVAAMSGEAYVAIIKKDGTMSDNRQKIPRSEVLAFIHNWATAEAERVDSDVISVTRGGVEVLEIKVKDGDFAVDLSECKYEG